MFGTAIHRFIFKSNFIIEIQLKQSNEIKDIENQFLLKSGIKQTNKNFVSSF